LIVALLPGLWMGLFSDNDEIIRFGTEYLRIVGPIYGFYGLGMALFFATQGFGSVILTVTANALRLLVSAGGAVGAIYWLGFGATGLFIAVAFGFVVYAALTAWAVLRVKGPRLQTAAEISRHQQSKGDSPHACLTPIYFAGR
jgi:Na+-driven multidrug efflux pump